MEGGESMVGIIFEWDGIIVMEENRPDILCV